MIGRVKVYEDDEIVVYRGLDDEEVLEVVAEIVYSRGCVRFEDIKSMLSGSAGEDRIRAAIRRLGFVWRGAGLVCAS